MTSTDEARRAVKETIEQLGGLDLVLANAVCRERWRVLQELITVRVGHVSPSGKT
jgi:hypothetical protein